MVLGCTKLRYAGTSTGTTLCDTFGVKLTDWLQAWGTVAGAVFAAVAAVVAFLVLVREIRVRRRDQDDLRASTARLVLVTTGQEEGEEPAEETIGLITSWEFLVNNFSHFPVVDVRVTAERLSGETVLTWATDLLKPGETSVLSCHFNPALSYSYKDYPPDLLRIKIVFTDDNGLRWQRTDRQQPKRIFASYQQSYHDFKKGYIS